MLFLKKEERNEAKRTVVVIGTSPLALFLIYALQQNDMDVVVLDTSGKIKEKKTCSYNLKNDFQAKNIFFDRTGKLDKKPEYCFVASSFTEYKNDVLTLCDAMLKDVPIVNFSSFYNHELLSQMKGIKEIRAYFKGWVVKRKKELSLLGGFSELKICCPEDMEKDLKKILGVKKIDVHAEKNTKNLFLQTLIPFVLGNLLVLVYDDNVSKLLADNKIRKKVDNIVDEVLQIVDRKDSLDKHVILSEIYAFPDGFISEFDSVQGVFILSQMIKGIDCFSTPNVSELVSLAMKKY